MGVGTCTIHDGTLEREKERGREREREREGERDRERERDIYIATHHVSRDKWNAIINNKCI